MDFNVVRSLFRFEINLNKSEIIPLGRVDNVEMLAAELGCGVGSLPTMYLGLPLGAPHSALGVWDSIEERFRKRLSSWKRQYISKGGRLTLIRRTLSSLPFTSSLCLECQRLFVLDWRRFRETFYGVVGI